jgi:hypothetical protein
MNLYPQHISLYTYLHLFLNTVLPPPPPENSETASHRHSAVCFPPSPFLSKAHKTETPTHFLRIPKNIRSLLVSSGGFSAVCAAAAVSISLVDEGAVLAGESSVEPEDSMTVYLCISFSSGK